MLKVLIKFFFKYYKLILVLVSLYTLWFIYTLWGRSVIYEKGGNLNGDFSTSVEIFGETTLDFEGNCPKPILDNFDSRNGLEKEKFAQEWFWEALGSGKLNTMYLYRDFLRDHSQKMPVSKKILHVHLVPFSHNDPGWLKTYDEYTVTTNQILDNMLEYMRQNSFMTYIFNEISFFERWWSNLSSTNKNYVLKLLASGRLELTTGSWTTPDEAGTYYWALIDNLIEGHQFIAQELAKEFLPEVEWQNDAFGLSTTMAYLLKLANVPNILIGRVNELTKMMLLQEKSFEFYWRQYFDKSGQHKTLAHVLQSPNYYTADACGTNEENCCLVDFTKQSKNQCAKFSQDVNYVTDENKESLAKLLSDEYRKLGSIYPHNQVLVPLGSDFGYDNARHFDGLKNYTKLFDIINSDPSYKMKVKFSTFKNYFAAVRKELPKFPLRTVQGDFYPCQDNRPTEPWTGYFTSRPYFKKLERQLQFLLRSADIFTSILYITGKIDQRKFSGVFSTLRKARRGLALFQHHDAITGTSVDYVADDYGKILKFALYNTSFIMGYAIGNSLGNDDLALQWAEEIKNDQFEIGQPVAISLKNGQTKILTICNSLPYLRNEIVSVRVNTYEVEILDDQQNPVPFQINPYFSPEAKVSMGTYEILIHIELLPLSIINLHIKQDDSGNYKDKLAHIEILGNSDDLVTFPKIFPIRKVSHLFLTHGKLKTEHDKETGYMKKLYINEKSIKMNIDFWVYKPMSGGLYIFGGGTPDKFDSSENFVYVIKGPLKEEIHSYDEARTIFHKQSISHIGNDGNNNMAMVEIENIIKLDKMDAEFVMRINSSINNRHQTYYTDSNGFQFVKRQYNSSYGVEYNYAPIASAAILEDKDYRLSLLSAQPHGGTSPMKGCLEIMLHRFVQFDDYRGAGTPYDKYKTKANFRLIIENAMTTKNEHVAHSIAAQQNLYSLLYRPVIFYSRASNIKNFIPLKTNFPCDYHFLNLRALNEKNFALILHRLHNNCDKHKENESDEENCYKQHGLMDFINYLNVNPASFRPCTLSGVSDESKTENYGVISAVRNMKIMDIKTFCFPPFNKK